MKNKILNIIGILFVIFVITGSIYALRQQESNSISTSIQDTTILGLNHYGDAAIGWVGGTNHSYTHPSIITDSLDGIVWDGSRDTLIRFYSGGYDCPKLSPSEKGDVINEYIHDYDQQDNFNNSLKKNGYVLTIAVLKKFLTDNKQWDNFKSSLNQNGYCPSQFGLK